MRALGADQPEDIAVIATDGLAELSVERAVAVAPTRERGFWTGFAIAATLHAMLLIGVSRAAPRQVGDADGSADGISINVVSEAELRGNATVAEAPQPPPGSPGSQAAPPPPQLKPTQQDDAPPKKDDADLPREPIAETQPKPEVKSEQPQEAAAADPTEAVKGETALATAIEKDVPDLLALPSATGSVPKKPVKDAAPAQPKMQPPAAKPAQQPSQSAPQKMAKLDLSPAAPAFNGAAGGAGRRAGLERPPGITRSGANDEFARNVVRALQQTMPQLRDVLGRVTVRILLNENGNVVDVQVLRPSSISQIDQSVVFAARQTSYPFPPPNSNVADRTFMITYIYH